MEQNISVALLNNATLLLALCVIYEVIYLLPSKYRRMQPVFNGLLIALICVAVMSVPFTFSPYIVFDTRTILISVTALIFGIIPTVITVVMASIFRVSLGGVGLLPGLATITTSAIIGLAWRRWMYPKSTKWAWLNIYAMSVTIHISMLACMLLLTYPNNLNVIRQIALPVMLIYPIATVLLSSLLIRQEHLRLSQDQLKQSEERFKLLFDQAPLAYQSLDIDGRFTAVNQQWLDTFGYSRGEVIGKWFGDFLSPINREVFNQNFPIFKAQGYKHAEFEVLHKNGNPLFIAFEGKIGYDLDGKFKQTHCILKDITKQKAAENSLRLSEEKYRKITENISEIIWTTDMNLKTTYVSPSIEYVLGESVQDHLKQSLEEKITPDCLIRVHELFSEELEKEKNNKSDKNRTRVIELEHYHADGSIVWLAMNISFLRDEFGNVIGLQGVSRDITELKHARDNLRYISEHDDLTGLYNRRYFEKEIKRLDVENQLPLSIIVVDINGLKLINDSFGRTEGDKTIKQTANILSSSLREGDVLARTGGDEFCILLSKTNIQTEREHLRTIEIACEQYNLKTPNKSFHINLSFGAATKETATVTFQHTYKEAEDYMRQRKLLVGKSSRSAVISSIKATMLEKSFETQEHEDRLSALTKKIGSIMNLSQIEINSLELLSKLHDIGKVAIAERILKKPGKLNEDEWIEMRKHPEIGYRIAMSSSETAPIAEYILCHHERWDGSGYPRKLRGTEIPLLSRILAIADAYDAMTENRVYNETRTPEEAFEEIKRCAGTQFNPEIAEIFVQMMRAKE